MASVRANVRERGIEIFIPTEYLENAFKMGLTTNVTGAVINQIDMLQYFAREIEKPNNDSFFGRFIDGVCEDALENGESFVEIEHE